MELTRAPFMPESPPGKPATWFTEYHGPGTGLTMKVLRTLYSAKSAFQEITLVETEDFGRVLLLDGVIQTTERDEFVYHEMLVHVPMCAHAGLGMSSSSAAGTAAASARRSGTRRWRK